MANPNPKTSRGGSRRRIPPKFRYAAWLEQLEDRVVPANLFLDVGQASGASPVVQAIPTSTVRVFIDVANLADAANAGGISSAQFYVKYDSSVLRINETNPLLPPGTVGSDVQFGSLFTGLPSNKYGLITAPDDGVGVGLVGIDIVNTAGVFYTGTAGGHLVELDFHVLQTAAIANTTLLDLTSASGVNIGNNTYINDTGATPAPYSLLPKPTVYITGPLTQTGARAPGGFSPADNDMDDAAIQVVGGTPVVAPTVVNDSYTMAAPAPGSGAVLLGTMTISGKANGVLGNDTDSNGAMNAFLVGTSTAGTATINGVTTPTFTQATAHGSVTLDEADGSFSYTPTTGFVGLDTFQYTASDALSGTASAGPATVTIQVGSKFRIPKILTLVSPATTVVVPVMIDDPDPINSGGLAGVTIGINYDATKFTVSASDVTKGALPTANNWSQSTVAFPAAGQIVIVESVGTGVGATPITTTVPGSLAFITLHLISGTPSGTSLVNLSAGTPAASGLLGGESSNPALAVFPPPIDDPTLTGSGSTDDGLITITPAAPPTTTTVSTSNAAPTYGTMVTLTATVAAGSGSAAPSLGSVQFSVTNGGVTTPLGGAVIIDSTSGTNAVFTLVTNGTTFQAGQTNAISAAYTAGAGFNASTSTNTVNETVTPFTLTVTGITANNKTYDNTTTATLNTTAAAVTGVISPDVVTLVTTGATGAFASKNVANGIAVTVSGLSLSGAQAADYALATPQFTTTANITAKTLTVIGITAANKPADGTTLATLNTTAAAVTGVISPDVVTLVTTGATGAFASSAVSNGITVTVSGLSLSGAQATNYALPAPQFTTTANITPTGNPPTAMTVSTSNATPIYGTAVTLTATVAATSGTTAPSLGSVQFSVMNGGVTTPLGGVVSTDTTSGTNAVFTLVTSPTALQAGQTNAISAAYTPGTGFAASASVNTVNETVAPMTITGSFTASSKTYDGTTTATITTRTLSGVLAADTPNVTLTGGTATFSDANVGNGKTVTATGFTLSGTAAGDYALASTAQALTAPILSGAVEFSANSDGSFFHQEYVNTLGGDSAWNLYVTQPNSGIAGPLLNSGDNPATRIAVALTPGTYTFNTFNQAGSVASGNPTGFFGLNLFFDSNDTIPRISVLAPTNFATSPPYPAFAANSNANTLTLQTTNAAAAGALAFRDGDFLLTLTDYRYSFPSVLNLDRVSSFNNVPDGSNNFVGQFTLTVTAVQPVLTTTANITAKTLTVTGITANNKFVDGTTVATLNTAAAAVTGVISPDVVTLVTTGAVGAFASAAVGNNITVSVSGLSLSGTAAANYALPTPQFTTTANITPTGNPPTAMTVSTSNATPTYGTAVTLTATVAATSGTAAPALGGVQFFVTNGGVTTPFGAVVTTDTTSGTNAVFTLVTSPTALQAGQTNAISAAYTPGTGFAGSASTTSVNETVSPFTVQANVTANNKTYDGTAAATLVFGTPALQGVIGTDAATLVTTGAVGTFSDKNVGTGKTVTVTGLSLSGAQAVDYVLGSPVATTANITALTITGSFTAANKTYDGSTSATITNRTVTGVLAADTANVTLTGGTATFSDANVGTGKTVSGTGFGLSGTASGNYTLTSGTLTTTANITPITVTGSFTASNKAYDGTTAATIATRTVTGVLAADTANVTLTGGTAAFSDANVGTGKTVTGIGFGLSGTASGNYVLAATTLATAANITALTVTGSFATANKPYDGTSTATITARTLTGVLAADAANVTLTGGTAAFSDANVGTGKTVTGSGFNLSGTATGNYTLASSTLTTTANMTALTVTGNFTAANKPYDGATAATITARTLTGVLAADTANVTLTGGTTTFSDKSVGIAKTVTGTGFTLTGTAANNYILSPNTLTTTANITALTVTGNFTAANKIYDATTAATITGRTLTGVLPADTANVTLTGGTATFSDSHVGTGKTVAGTGFTLGGSASGNYTLTSSALTTTANITPDLVNIPIGAVQGTGSTISSSVLKADSADNPAIVVYTLVSAPSGTLKDGTTTLTAGSTFTQADINAGSLSYTGTAAGPDSFQFSVTDGQGGTVPVSTFQINVSSTTNNIHLPGVIIGTKNGLEGDAITFQLTLASMSGSPVTYDVFTTDGTAVAGTHYTGIHAGDSNAPFDVGTITIPAGLSKGTITVKTTAGASPGGTASKFFTVSVSNPSNPTIPLASATGLIISQTSTGNVQGAKVIIGNQYGVEGFAGTATPFIFQAILSAAPSAPTTYDVFTTNGTAIAGTNYIGITPGTNNPPHSVGTVTFAARNPKATFTVYVIGGSLPTNVSAETFTVSISDPTHPTVALATATGTIEIQNPQMALGTPTQAAGGVVLSSSASSTKQLNAIVAAAEANWAAAGASIAKFQGVQFLVANIATSTNHILANTVGKTITIDAGAAGFGWYIDAGSAAFQKNGASADLTARAGTSAVGHMDLLTVVEHELGHILGLTDVTSGTDTLMSEGLGAGTRRLPDASALVSIVPPSTKLTQVIVPNLAQPKSSPYVSVAGLPPTDTVSTAAVDAVFSTLAKAAK